MKSAFLNEAATRDRLAEFVRRPGQLSMGPKCAEFEEAFARYQDCRHAVLFNSGGSANLAVLQALKNLGVLKAGDRVGFSALTWSTNVMPIIQLDLVPVPVDCEPATLNVMSRHLETTLATVPLRAMFITNALGLTGDMDRIRALCEARGVLLLEDNCESLGSETRGGKAGNFGRASTFSFFVAHHMSTIEGGMVCTNDDEIAEMLRIVRANGWDRNLTAGQQAKWRDRFAVQNEFEAKYTFYDIGCNLRPTEITGFLGLVQLEYLDENVKARQRIHAELEKVIRANPDLIPLDCSHMSVYSSFATVILCRTPRLRAAYIERFAAAGVEIRPVIAGNMERQPFFRKYVQERYGLPGADFVHDHGFYFGNYPELSPDDLAILRSCLESPRESSTRPDGKSAQAGSKVGAKQ